MVPGGGDALRVGGTVKGMSWDFLVAECLLARHSPPLTELRVPSST